MRTLLGNLSLPNFVVDHQSVDLTTGRQIDWDAIPAGFTNAATGLKELPAGTAMVEQADGTVRARASAVVGAGEALLGVLASAAEEGSTVSAANAYGIIAKAIVYEQLLPDVDDAGWAAIRADLVTRGFLFEQYEDSRAV